MLKTSGLPPVARRVLSEPPGDDVGPVFYKSALIAKAWLDPDTDKTDLIFKEMIESVTSGRLRVQSAVSNAAQELDDLFRSNF